MDSINDRIRKLRIEFCDDSNIKFAKKTGKKPNTVNNWVRNGYSVGRGVLSVILETFPDVNPEWLLRGDGSMLKSDRKESLEHNMDGKMVPLYDITEINTFSENTDKLPAQPITKINIGWMLKDSELALRIYGNSMAPHFPSGCLVSLKPHMDSFIEPGNVYVVETKNHRYIKRLYTNKHKNAYRCVSDNHMVHESGPMKGEYVYPDFEIPFKEVSHVYQVTGVIRRDSL